MKWRRNKAFTLEILIVVVILGILAAIVVPQFTNASTDAQIGNVETQLQTLRSQIELYRVRHNGAYPDFAALASTGGGWGDNTNDGMIQANYLRATPVNPRNSSSSIALVSGATYTHAGSGDHGGAGWVFNTTTGDLYATFFDETTRTWEGP